MTRRGLFGLMSLPWFAPKVRYSPVPVGGNTFITTEHIAKEALLILRNNLTYAAALNEGDRITIQGVGAFRIGDTITVRKPMRFQGGGQ